MAHPTVEGKTLWDAREDQGPYNDLIQSLNATADEDFLDLYSQEQGLQRAASTDIRPLGSGSDYTVFLQRLGVASSDQGFGGTPTDAVYHYHSIYDTHSWQERYADPGFHRHVRLLNYSHFFVLKEIYR